MYCTKQITQDVYWVGGSDRRLALFENAFPVPRGMSYNSYLVLDEKTVLFDTVDMAISSQLNENITYLLAGRPLDYLVVSHMEPDHSATLLQILALHPETTVVGNERTRKMLNQFFPVDLTDRMLTVSDGDTLSTGRHTFTFVLAPMVHWPEVMVTYDSADRALYSADAFGTFGALAGNIFADELDFERDWLPDARRYYANIVGKYGKQVQDLLHKAAGMDISLLLPLHGPLWRDNISWFISKYDQWSRYEPEEQSVMIVCGSVYRHTENAAEILAMLLSERGVRNITLYDVSVAHPSQLVAEAFRCSHLVLASATYNSGVFTNMEILLHDLQAHQVQNRTVALIDNGSWAATAGKQMRRLLDEMNNMTILSPSISLKSALKEDQLPHLAMLADAIVASLGK